MTQQEIFSKNLKTYLHLRNKKQADLCKYLKVSSATVSDWCNEKKMPKMERIGEIADWLNIQITDLFKNDMPDKSKITIYADDELKDLISSYNKANPELRKAALAVLKS